jgi:hypothetical protein
VIARRETVGLDAVQAAWLDAVADLWGCSRAAVLREALRYLAARETVRVARSRHYALIGELSRAERFDPIGDFLAGRHSSSL